MVVGISAMTIQSSDTRKLIKLIRKWNNNVIIIVGGKHFTALPKEGIEFGGDYVITGEGEIALSNFMLNGPSKDTRIIQGETLSNLDDIPLLKMDDIRPFIENIDDVNKHGFHIITSRGCPYNCNFCLSREQRPKGMRYHSVDYIVKYISKVVSEFNINSFFIADDIFIIKSSRVREFCSKIKNKISKKLNFHCFTHAGHGNTELYKEMLSVGFYKISMGVEHGNEEILNLCGKNVTKLQIEKTCKELFNARININLLYILGNIKETNQTISETIDFSIYLHKKYKARSYFSFMQPLPGSPIYGYAKEYGNFLSKERTFQNNDLNFIPFGTSANHMLKEMKRGFIMGNYSGPLKKYKSVQIAMSTRSKFNRIPGARIINYISYKIAQIYDKL